MQEVSPMKKVTQILLCISLIALAFVVGLFVFRNHGSRIVRITDYIPPTITSAEKGFCPIDINTADVAALMTVPGIGEAYAQRIVDYRREHGAFTAITDLLNVPGIGQKRLDAITQYITIGGSDENTGCR
jgi:competence ComEA-like helix-hairpin-helix protein